MPSPQPLNTASLELLAALAVINAKNVQLCANKQAQQASLQQNQAEPLTNFFNFEGLSQHNQQSFVSFSVTQDAIAQLGTRLEDLRLSLQAALRAHYNQQELQVVLTAQKTAQTAAPAAASASSVGERKPLHATAQAEPIDSKRSIPGVKHVIAVGSGKGGVGKSTTAVNLALSLQNLGLKVGMLDADIYGPSLPTLLGVSGQPQVEGQNTILPLESYGLSLMSMGFMIAPDNAMIWRGPMIQSAITQMLYNVKWGQLDVLVIDLPPGTGDAQLTLAQKVPLSGAVIVSTPQDLALLDAKKAISMFRKVSVPILGLIENMSYYTCPHCHTTDALFGNQGAQNYAKANGIHFLGALPLDIQLRISSDEGKPVCAVDVQAAQPNAKTSAPLIQAYQDIAQAIKDQLRL